MKNITVLIDYKNSFSSKSGSVPYRSGLDKQILANSFEQYGISVKYVKFSAVDFSQSWKDQIVLYTSSEDNNLLYKSYIEDVIQGLELAGAAVIPSFKYLRAHHNKVFMEILREIILGKDNSFSSLCFGTLEELENALKQSQIIFPCVLKTASGAMSRGVGKAENSDEIRRMVKKMCLSKDIKYDLHDFLRNCRYDKYIRESQYRNKFIVQPMIEGLANDWKLLIFNNRIYNLKRHVRKNDFRASGSHVDYKIGSESGLTTEMMNFAFDIYQKLDVPMLSFDLAYDGKKCYMIEFQTLYFGTSTFSLSKDYYCLENNRWTLKENIGTLEELYAWSINTYLEKKGLK